MKRMTTPTTVVLSHPDRSGSFAVYECRNSRGPVRFLAVKICDGEETIVSKHYSMKAARKSLTKIANNRR